MVPQLSSRFGNTKTSKKAWKGKKKDNNKNSKKSKKKKTLISQPPKLI